MSVEIVDSKSRLDQLEVDEENRLPFIDDHFSMEAFRKREVVLEDANGQKYSLGAHYNGYGKGIVKGGNLCFRVKVMDGKEMLELDFKINHVFRTYLAGRIHELKQDPDHYISPQQIKGEMGGYQDQLIERYVRKWDDEEKVLSMGADPKKIGLYTRIIVHVPVTTSLTDLQNFLASIHLDDVLTPLSSEDLERLKIGYLFHLFSLKASYFERDLKFYLLPISDLKAQILQEDPKMKEIFDKYLPKIETYQPLQGRVRYRIQGLGKECEDLGARVLIASIFDKHHEIDRTVSILKMGLLSTEMRLASHMGISASAPNDVERGSSDSVFVQLVTNTHYQEGHLSPLGFSQDANVTFLLDLNLVETGTYQYHFISGGTRNLLMEYQDRPSLLKFVKREMQESNRTSNELMIKDRIPPCAIKGIRVGDEKTRQTLVQKIREAGLIENQKGVETIFNCPVQQFIQLKTVFPNKLNSVKVINPHMDGDLATQLVEDPQGKQFILRQTTTQVGSLLVEHSLANAYRVLGIAVPEVALYIDVTGEPLLVRGYAGNPSSILAADVKGMKVTQYLDPSHPSYADRLKEVQNLAKKGFVADCLLGNEDPFKNMILDVESKTVWRTQHTSGLWYKIFDERKQIEEFQKLRDPQINPTAALLFATLTDEEIIEQIDTILPKKEMVIATLFSDYDKKIMEERFAYLKSYRDSLKKPWKSF